MSAGLLDVAPTILELLGIPPAADMPGRVLTEVFVPGTATLPRRETPYVRNATASGGSETSKADDALVERLRALGYMQ